MPPDPRHDGRTTEVVCRPTQQYGVAAGRRLVSAGTHPGRDRRLLKRNRPPVPGRRGNHRGPGTGGPVAASACEALGLDVFQVANEGKMLIIVAPEDAPKALFIIRRSPYGEAARGIGKVSAAPPAGSRSRPSSAPPASWTLPRGICCRGYVDTYSVCLKFFPLGGSQIPLNPPFSKGDFNSNSL